MVTIPTALVLVAAAVAAEGAIVDVKVDSPSIRFTSASLRQRILVEGVAPGGEIVDLTHSAGYRSLDPRVATVDREGVVRPAADGTTTVLVRAQTFGADGADGAEKGVRSRCFRLLTPFPKRGLGLSLRTRRRA